MLDAATNTPLQLSDVPTWAQAHAQAALELMPARATIANVHCSLNGTVNITIGDGAGQPLGQLVVSPPGPGAENTLRDLHIHELAVRHGAGLIWVTLGQVLDPLLAARHSYVVIRITKPDDYEVTTVSRGMGRPQRYRFPEEQIAAVRLSAGMG